MEGSLEFLAYFVSYLIAIHFEKTLSEKSKKRKIINLLIFYSLTVCSTLVVLKDCFIHL